MSQADWAIAGLSIPLNENNCNINYIQFSLKSNMEDVFIQKRISSHWDFLPKILSLHYYTTLEGFLGVQRRGQAQGTIICLFGPLFFSQNGMTFKNPTKISKSSEKLLFFGIFSEFVQFWLENSGPNQLLELKWIILLLLTPKPSLEAE